MILCKYGCNQEARYKLKNEAPCCSQYCGSCPEVKKKNSNALKSLHKIQGKFKRFTDEDRARSNKKKIDKSVKKAFVENSTYSNVFIRKKLIQYFHWKYECKLCEITEWLGEKLTFDLDHINGNHNDNRIDNLRFLCPNCHAQTATYKGKNKNNGKVKATDYQIVEAIQISKSIAQVLRTVGLTPKGLNYNRVKKLIEKHNVDLLK